MPARHRPAVHTLAALILSAALAGAAPAAPPTDAQVDALIIAVNEAGKDITDPMEKAQAQQAAAKAGMSEISWSEVTPAQFDRLASKGLMRPYPDIRTASFERLKTLAKEPTVEGARCADILMACWPQPTDPADRDDDTARRADALMEALRHPRMGDLYKAGKGGNITGAIPQFPASMVRERGMIDALEPYITTDLHPLNASALGGIFDVVTSEEFGATPEYARRIREKIAAAATAAAAKDEPRLADEPKQAARVKKNLLDLAATCNSAHARGELIDHPAPPIAFTWSNHPTTLKSFEDLKGNVVIVDFWATWCGPCIAAFPKMRDLAAHYDGYPVVILGVTSEQGFHIARKQGDSKPERIDCEDPRREYELMAEFIKDMNVTWPVAFSDKNVFNPDFGVRGIPHIAIIDPAGKVRYNALRPGSLAQETDKIDDLLREAKLPVPAAKFAEKK